MFVCFLTVFFSARFCFENLHGVLTRLENGSKPNGYKKQNKKEKSVES
jgi:hypothetical protein